MEQFNDQILKKKQIEKIIPYAFEDNEIKIYSINLHGQELGVKNLQQLEASLQLAGSNTFVVLQNIPGKRVDDFSINSIKFVKSDNDMAVIYNSAKFELEKTSATNINEISASRIYDFKSSDAKKYKIVNLGVNEDVYVDDLAQAIKELRQNEPASYLVGDFKFPVFLNDKDLATVHCLKGSNKLQLIPENKQIINDPQKPHSQLATQKFQAIIDLESAWPVNRYNSQSKQVYNLLSVDENIFKIFKIAAHPAYIICRDKYVRQDQQNYFIATLNSTLLASKIAKLQKLERSCDFSIVDKLVELSKKTSQQHIAEIYNKCFQVILDNLDNPKLKYVFAYLNKTHSYENNSENSRKEFTRNFMPYKPAHKAAIAGMVVTAIVLMLLIAAAVAAVFFTGGLVAVVAIPSLFTAINSAFSAAAISVPALIAGGSAAALGLFKQKEKYNAAKTLYDAATKLNPN